jgi:nucleoside-triphosphatase
MEKNIIITGLPGVGKTTLIKAILHEIRSLNPIGFYTEEIREQGIRKGFSLLSVTGEKSILASENIPSRFRVGKYGVDLVNFENFIGTIPFRDPANSLIVIDEIGKMECFSKMFTELVIELLSSNKLVVATVALKGTGLMAQVKSRPDIELIEITTDNRNDLLPSILSRIALNRQRSIR